MHDVMPYGRNQGQGQGHSREVNRQSPTGLIFHYSVLRVRVNFIINNNSGIPDKFQFIWFDTKFIIKR